MSRNCKPLDLPGLYWDDERRRYFPVASRPKRKAVHDEPPELQATPIDTRRSNVHPVVTARYTKTSRAGLNNYSQRTRIAHEIEGGSLVASYTELDPPVRPLSWHSSKITSFHATTIDDTLNLFAGDSHGVLHCSRTVTKSCAVTYGRPDRFNDNSRLFTSYHLGPGAPISHIVTSGNTAVAISSACDSCLLGIRDLKAPDYSGISFPRINVSGDVRAASLSDKSLALGMSKKLVWVKDVGASTKGHRSLHVKSDVLSICQSSNTVTAGLRNGEVRLFDVRARGDASSELFGSRFSNNGDGLRHSSEETKAKSKHSAITHLRRVGDWEMLVGTSAGELEMFDLRFATGSQVLPTISYQGHVNSYLLDLGITIDPSASFLFAAGQDRRIRAWSLRTGEQLGTLLGGAQLSTPARALEVTQSDDTTRGARWLWVAQEDEVRVARLGGA